MHARPRRQHRKTRLSQLTIPGRVKKYRRFVYRFHHTSEEWVLSPIPVTIHHPTSGLNRTVPHITKLPILALSSLGRNLGLGFMPLHRHASTTRSSQPPTAPASSLAANLTTVQGQLILTVTHRSRPTYIREDTLENVPNTTKSGPRCPARNEPIGERQDG
jgi:hypothetical protein